VTMMFVTGSKRMRRDHRRRFFVPSRSRMLCTLAYLLWEALLFHDSGFVVVPTQTEKNDCFKNRTFDRGAKNETDFFFSWIDVCMYGLMDHNLFSLLFEGNARESYFLGLQRNVICRLFSKGLGLVFVKGNILLGGGHSFNFTKTN